MENDSQNIHTLTARTTVAGISPPPVGARVNIGEGICMVFYSLFSGREAPVNTLRPE